MQLTPFVLLLGTLLAITSSLDVYALPLKRQRTGLVTLPLKRTPVRRDLHPHMLLKMHNIRSQRRLARMAGRDVPSTEALLAREAHIADRSPARVSYPVSKLGHGNKNPNILPTGELSEDGNGNGDGSPQTSPKGALTIANKPTTPNSLGLDIESIDTGYVATILVGTPPRNFSLLMDSGSADFWVGAEGCQSDDGTNCGNHSFLGPQSSSSFVDLQKPFNVTYGKGSVAGSIITDNLVVAGLPLLNHTFGVATKETVEFSSNQVGFDGIMGVAQSILSNQGVKTPVEALADAGSIEPITSFKISRLADNKNDGEVTFGGLDPTKFDQTTLATIDNVNKHGFWEGQLDAVSVNGADLGLTNRTTILDTGTTLLIVPLKDAQAIHQAIPGAADNNDGTFTVPCQTKASLALTFGGQSFPIDSRDIAFAPLDQNNPNGDCLSGITAGDLGGPTRWLAGDVFLKNAYFSTNVGNNTIQLAKQT